ncbi:MAG: BrnT family toxin [Bryobacterales bacterium]|nr:BrnT family toxin [Bryobacterales bacterium]
MGVHLCTVTAFEWDPRKAANNARKHGVRFADAVTVLEDEQALTLRDDGIAEERWVTIGMDGLARILTVVYTWRGNNVRIISARPATPRERQQYMENS